MGAQLGIFEGHFCVRDVWSQGIATFIYCSVRSGIKQISFSKLPLCDVSVPLPLFLAAAPIPLAFPLTPHLIIFLPSYLRDSPAFSPTIAAIPNLLACLPPWHLSVPLPGNWRQGWGEMVFSQWESQGTVLLHPPKASCLLPPQPLVTQRRAPAWGLSSRPCSLPAPPTPALKWR